VRTLQESYPELEFRTLYERDEVTSNGPLCLSVLVARIILLGEILKNYIANEQGTASTSYVCGDRDQLRGALVVY